MVLLSWLLFRSQPIPLMGSHSLAHTSEIGMYVHFYECTQTQVDLISRNGVHTFDI